MKNILLYKRRLLVLSILFYSLFLFCQDAEEIEYRADSSIMTVSGKDKEGKYYRKMYDNKGNIAAIFKTEEKKCRFGFVTFFGDGEKMEYQYIDYLGYLDEIRFFRDLGYTSRITYSFAFDSSDYIITLKLYDNGKIAIKSYKSYHVNSTNRLTNYYYSRKGVFLGFGQSDENYLPLEGLYIQYYSNRNSAAPAVPMAIFKSKDGIIESGVFYNTKGVEIGKCQYRNGSPFNGKILEPDFSGAYFTLKEFKEGFPIGDIYEFDYYFKLIETPPINTIANKDKIIKNPISGNKYKNGQPYTGVFDIWPNIVEMKKGKKNGITKEYDYVSKDTISITTYKDDVKHGYCAFTPIHSKVFAEGNYKEGKPYDGDFVIERLNFHQTIYTYSQGVLTKKTYYIPVFKNNHYLQLKYYGTCSFKDGKPFQGLFMNENSFEFCTYENGVINGVCYSAKDGIDTTQLTTYQNGKRNGISFSRYSGTDYKIVVTYKDDLKYNGIFPNEKNLNEKIEYKEGVPIKLYESTAYVNRQFEIINGIKGGECIQTIRNNATKWRILYKDNLPFEGELLKENKIITYKEGIESGPVLEYADNNLHKLNARYTFLNGLKHGRAVAYNVFEDGDSIVCEYKNDLLYNGTTVFFVPNTGIKKVYTMENGSLKSDSLYLYSSRADAPKKFLKFKNGKKFEGIEYIFNPFELTNIYKDSKLIESTGKNQDKWAFYLKCNGNKCIFTDDFHHISSVYLYDSIQNTLKVVTKYKTDKADKTTEATIKNDTLFDGSIMFYNYNSRNYLDFKIWDLATITLGSTGTSIELLNKKSDFYPVYKFSRKLKIPFPFYDPNNLIAYLLSKDEPYEIEYKDKETHEILATCTGVGWTIKDGFDMVQNENKVNIQYYKQESLVIEEEISSVKIKEWVEKVKN